MTEKQVAISAENTLRKLGAHLRWFIERAGVDPEKCHVIIGVPSTIDQSLIRSEMLREFDKGTMTDNASAPTTTWVHGVPITICVTKPASETA